MRHTIRLFLGLCAAAALSGPTSAEASLTRIAGPTTNHVESRLFVKFDAAFDNAHQLHLIVWGTQGFGPANGLFIDVNGNVVGAPFPLSDGPYQAGWARVIYSADQGKFLVSYTKILTQGVHQRVARFVIYQSPTDRWLGPEIIIDTWNGGAGGEPGMAYSRGRFLVTWWNWNSVPPQSYVAVLDGAGNVLVPKVQVTMPGDGQTDPEIACDESRGRCLVVGQAWGVYSPNGATPGTWAIVIDDQSAQPVTGGFFVDFWPVEKEASIAYSSAGNRFIVAFSREQNAVWAVTVDAASLAPGAPYPLRLPGQDPEDGGGYGRPRLAYNATTQTSILAVKPWIARTGALELDANGGIVPNTWQMTPTAGHWSQGTQELATAADPVNSRFIISDNQAYLTMRSSIYLAQGGGNPPPPPPPPPPGPGAFERAKADFDGDGTSDLVWQNMASGLLSLWQMTSSFGIKNASFFQSAVNDPNWRIVGTGDFNADGKPDLLWRHNVHGELVVWYQNGLSTIDDVFLSISQVADMRWKIVGVGDFNGDLKPDIAWQHDSGWIATWIMSGVTVVESRMFNPDVVADTRWKVAGVGDFNADGKSDLVWRHDNGWTAVWLMNGTSLGAVLSFSPPVVDPAWRIAAVLDANGDGKADVVWQHSNGWIALWVMDGVNRVQTVSVGQVADTNWKIVGSK